MLIQLTFSSSTTSTSSTTSVIFVPATTFTPLGATTIIDPITPGDSATLTSQAAIATGHNDTAKSGFLANKGAMGGVFTLVAILALGAGFALFVFCQRRRRQKRYAQQDEYFEKFNPDNTQPKRQDLMSMDFGGNEGMGPNSSSGMAAATAAGAGAAGLGAGGQREPTYPQVADPYGIDRMQDYGLSYPPGAQPYNPGDYAYTGYGNNYGSTSQAQQQYQSAQYYQPEQQQQQQYQQPTHDASASSSGNNLAPPTSYPSGQRPSNVRAYEHSVDSFYGAGNRSSGAVAL